MSDDVKEQKKLLVSKAALKVLSAAINDKTILEKICKEFAPDSFPKEFRDFALVVWELGHKQRTKITKDVLTHFLAAQKKSPAVCLSCEKVFSDCQADPCEADRFKYYYLEVKKYKAERVIREALQGTDEDGRPLLDAKGKAVPSVVELLVEKGDPYKAADRLKEAVAQVQGLAKEDPIIRVEIRERALVKGDEYDLKKTNKEGVVGLLTGFGPLDDVTRGVHPGEIIIVGARPGAGKSICLLNMAINMFKQGKNIQLFSLEMPATQYEDRFISAYAEINNNRMALGALTEPEETLLKKSWQNIATGPGSFQIIDFPRIDSFQLETELCRQFDKCRPDCLFIDYLGIMKPNDKGSGADWESQGRIAEEVRTVARTYNVPILSAVQLNRSKSCLLYTSPSPRD